MHIVIYWFRANSMGENPGKFHMFLDPKNDNAIIKLIPENKAVDCERKV